VDAAALLLASLKTQASKNNNVIEILLALFFRLGSGGKTAVNETS